MGSGLLMGRIRLNPLRLMIVVLLLTGSALVVQALWIPVKAQVAQVLLLNAWQRTQHSGTPEKPWPWADHYPVARLVSKDHQVEQIVLAGDSGSSLAFAPGENMQARAIPHAARVISGHRDTHFRFLQQMGKGELLTLENPDSQESYRVTDIRVVDSAQVQIDPGGAPDSLLLITCYPFDSLSANGSLRYVVSASRVF